MLAQIVFLMVILPAATACVASGICGGGGLMGMGSPCYSPIPPVAPTCAGGMGCGPGYGCGAFGCFRMRRVRALSSGATFTPEGAVKSVSSQRKYISSLLGGRSFEEEVAIPEPPTDPNALFMACCEQRKLPDACLRKCTFNTFTKESLTRMYFKQDACPLSASTEIQFCAAQGRDHRSCCARNGVGNTIAGPKCLTFCDQRPGNVTLLDFSYISCYDRFENMKSCFWYDAVSRFN